MKTGRKPTLGQVMLLLVAAVCMCVLSACGSSSGKASAGDAGPPRHGGQVVLGMDQEPPCINTWLVCGGMAAASLMSSPMFDSLLGVDDKGERYPLMATDIPTTDNGMVRVADGKMFVDIEIRPEAHWSDGEPVTCEDMQFTWQTIMNDDWMVGSRLGWEKIEKIDCPSERKINITFMEPYAPYLLVVGTAPLPKHALEGKDFNTFWNDRITVSSGPFKFGHWKRNVEYVLERNPDYWNKGKNDLPYLDSIKYRFLKDTNTLKIQLRTGEVDWITPPPDTSLIDELKSFPRSSYQVVAGSFWENFAFQNASPPLDDVNVRKALAYAIDRDQITDVVLRKQVKPLNSTFLPSLKDYYIPAWDTYSYDEGKVKEYLTKAGYQRKGEYYEKGGKPLQVLFKSTAGNALRMKVAQLLQQRFKANGIKMDIMLEDPGVFFGQSTVGGSYQVAVWAWGSSMEPTQTSLWSCDQIPTKKNNFEGNNNYRYCNEDVTKLLKKADATPDIAARAAVLHEIQKQMAQDIPVLPLYQRPETIAYSNRLQGVKNNPFGGQLWNIYDWWVTK